MYLKKSVLGVCPAVTKIDQRRKYVGVSVFECLMFLRQAAGSTPMAQDCCASLPADKKFVIYFLSRGLPDRIEIIYLASLYSVFSMFRVLKALKQAKKKPNSLDVSSFTCSINTNRKKRSGRSSHEEMRDSNIPCTVNVSFVCLLSSAFKLYFHM